MKAISISALLLFSISAQLLADPYMAGAVEASADVSPWVTAVLDAEVSDQIDLICSGALVHPKFVVVAAHSVTGKTPAQLQCVIGAHELTADSMRRDVVDIIVHPQHELDRWQIQQFDVALLRLKEPEEAVTPVPLLEALDPLAVEVPMETTVIGWAATSAAGPMEARPLALTLPLVSLETANQRLSYNTLLKESHLPIGTATMESDACLDTSSAPVIISTDQGDQLAGLVSFGKGCQVPNWYRVCSNIHFYRSWIGSYLWPDYTAWEIANGAHGFYLDRNGDGVANGAEYGFGNAVSSSVENGSLTWRFRSEAGDVSRFVQRSGDLEVWTDADVSTSIDGDVTVWRLTTEDPPAGSLFGRLGARPGGAYLPVPKPIGFGTDLDGEMIGPDELVGANQYVREYALGDLPGGNIAVRIVAEDFDPTIKLIDPDSGDVLSQSSSSRGEPATLTHVAALNKPLIATVETNAVQGFGEFQLLISGAPKTHIAPTSFNEVLVELTKTVVFNITNLGEGLLDFTVSSRESWVTVHPSSGALGPRQTATVRVDIDGTNLPTGDFSAIIDVVAGDGTDLEIPLAVCALPDYPLVTLGNPSKIGQLAADDPESFHRPGLPMDPYIFRPTVSGRYRIAMASGVLDCYLYLMEAKTGRLLAEADDSGNAHPFNSAITVDLQRDTAYIIEATIYGSWNLFPSTTGPYQLIITQ